MAGAPKATTAFGRPRKYRVQDLQAGQMLLDRIYGRRGNLLMDYGEVLSQKHIDKIHELCKLPGEGNLLLYTREVWAKTARGSARLRPKCDEDPYAAISVQKYYHRGGKLQFARALKPSSARKVYKMGKGGVLVEKEVEA